MSAVATMLPDFAAPVWKTRYLTGSEDIRIPPSKRDPKPQILGMGEVGGTLYVYTDMAVYAVGGLKKTDRYRGRQRRREAERKEARRRDWMREVRRGGIRYGGVMIGGKYARYLTRRERKWEREKTHGARRAGWAKGPRFQMPGYIYVLNEEHPAMKEAYGIKEAGGA